MGNIYILVDVDYVLKWVEAQALLINDVRACNFLKSCFLDLAHLGYLLVIEVCIFVTLNLRRSLKQMEWPTTPYNPQINGHFDVTNRELKWILEKMVSAN